MLDQVQTIMEDSVIQQDRDKILSILKKSEKAKQNRQKTAEALSSYFQETIRQLPPAKAAERKKSLAKKTKKEEGAVGNKKKEGEAGGSSGSTKPSSKMPTCEPGSSYENTKYDDVNEAMDNFIKKGKPEYLHVLTDAKNGRWRITWKSAEATEQRSISWTSVGAKLAAEEVLTQAWNWSVTHRGEAMTEHAKKVLAELRSYKAPVFFVLRRGARGRGGDVLSNKQAFTLV